MALHGVAEAMYSDAAVAGRSRRRSPPRRRATVPACSPCYDSYYQRQPDGTWDNSLEAFQVIHCMDTAERLTVEEEDATAPQFNEVAPGSPRARPAATSARSSRSRPIRGSRSPAPAPARSSCAVPPATRPRHWRAPATWPSTLEDGRLIIIDANQHTCYGADPCADELIDDYLVNLNAPPAVTEC